MSVNRFVPHVLVLPEDDANRQLANGFLNHPSVRSERAQVLGPAGGWAQVLATFERDLLADMQRVPQRHVVFVLDFDGQVARRREQVAAVVPADLVDRVFLLGALGEPETLRGALRREGLNGYEAIGAALAEACLATPGPVWGHELLAHNAEELARLAARVRPFLIE